MAIFNSYVTNYQRIWAAKLIPSPNIRYHPKERCVQHWFNGDSWKRIRKPSNLHDYPQVYPAKGEFWDMNINWNMKWDDIKHELCNEMFDEHVILKHIIT